jgi:hypothetical protein
MINSSRCGASFRGEMKHVERSVLRFEPDLVILGLVPVEHEEGAGFEQCAGHGRAYIERVREACGADVLLCTHNPVVFGFWQPLPEGAEPGEAFAHSPRRPEAAARALARLGEETGCAVCDHYALWKRHRVPYAHPGANMQQLRLRMSPDTVHPGPIGHLALFRDLAPLFDVAKYFPWEEVGTEVQG